MEKPMQEKVAFLGAGNIAKAIMGGMLKKGVPSLEPVCSRSKPKSDRSTPFWGDRFL